ncbi:molybdopterin-guanine dinucleotide biosynthesis protein MobA [Stieleria maiorica]|uniref:Probable molybdenum cofactor guanylyltransferase n=1 Tax=Stieleria maiorica TaxID=2795974 RepID=A0A5B9M5S7_9BACT|nr:molybdenum cofactor guanylyltransferase [Stieleria maiorica]QEF95983.1 molybdopterin-guanine dinucleotide biosynthesis protein MobA [Stieleria maiorica]
MPLPDPKLLGVVLCGGASKRMGRDKAALMTHRGLSFLDHACQRLQSVCGTVCVSSSVRRDTELRHILDPPKSHGPISGIHASLTFARDHGFDACVFSPVDTPALTSDDLKTMLAVFADHRDRVVCAVSDQTTDSIEPLIAIYPATVCDVVDQSIQNGQYSPRRLLRSLSVVTVPLSSTSCHNINTPADLKPPSPES